MFEMIKGNIKSFLDPAVFLTMIIIGMFSILADYRYFKRAKYRKDAAAALWLGLAYLLLPFVLFFIIKL